jgi:hypothetical protein
MLRKFIWLTTAAIAVLAFGSIAYPQGPGMNGNRSQSFIGYEGHNMEGDLILPQLVVGQHYTTSLLLLSMGNSQQMTWIPSQNLVTTGKIYFYRQDGTRLPVSVNGGAAATELPFSLDPSKSTHFELSSSGPDTSAWALIDVDEPSTGSGWGMMNGQAMNRGARIMATVFYTYQGGGQPASRVGVVPTMYQMGQFATSIITVLSDDNLYTGVAIVNTNSKTITVNLRLKDSNGNVLSSTPLSLNPGSQIARFIFELFSTTLPNGFRGDLEIDSNDEGIVAMGLLVSNGVLTSVPMMHYGQISMMP